MVVNQKINMNYLQDKYSILIAKLMINNIRRGYISPSCEEEYDEHCFSCEALKIIKWLEHHIKMCKEY